MKKKKLKFLLELKNNRVGDIIFPIPQTNHYQEIFNLQTFPSNQLKKLNDNKIALFTLNDVKQKIKISFNVNLKPYSSFLNKNYKINDYSKNLLLAYQSFLKPNRFINGNDPEIKKIAKQTVDNEKSLNLIVAKLYQLTIKYLNYGNPIEGLYPYKQAIEERITDCGGFSTFLASLFQSLNIPARLVVGFLIKDNLKTKIFNLFYVSRFMFYVLCFTFHNLIIHAWLEILLPDHSWFPLDPSIEWRRNKRLTKRQGGFGFIPADRLVTSFGCDFKLKLNNKNYPIDLLQKPIILDHNANPNYTPGV